MTDQFCLLSFLACMTRDPLSVHKPNLLYGFINDLLLIPSLVELFGDLSLFSQLLIVRTDAFDKKCKTE